MSMTRIMKLLVCIAVFLALSGCGGGSSSSSSSRGGGTALVAWTPPDRNVDGSTLPVTDLAGYRIYYGNAPGDYDHWITIENMGMTSYLIENLDKADWYFAMTAFNSLGIESDYSNEIYKAID